MSDASVAAPSHEASRPSGAFADVLAASRIAKPGETLLRPQGVGGFDVSLAAHARGAVRLATTQDLWTELTPEGDRDVAPVVESGVARFGEVTPGLDVVHAAHVDANESWFEELRVLRDARARTEFSWRVRVGPAVREVRARGRFLEVVDHAGRAHVRSPQPYAIDANGTRRDAPWTLARDGADWIVSTRLDARGLAYPITLDPAWFSTGTMATPRFHVPAIVMKDGRVLVAGGSIGIGSATGVTSGMNAALASAEIFDPKSGTWTLAAPMSVARFAHGAALLPSGKVLVAGGVNASGWSNILSSAEIYDPSTDAWTSTAPIAEGLYEFKLVPTGKGTILRAGGFYNAQVYDNQLATRATGETFDETTGKWTPVANTMANPRALYGAVTLPSGAVFITGGFTNESVVVQSSTVIYDPASNLFAPGAALPDARFRHATVSTADGRVLVAGGLSSHEEWWNQGPLTTLIFDPTTGVWTSLPPLPNVRSEIAAVTAPGTGGLTYLIGGVHGDFTMESNVLAFDPTTSAWTSGGTLRVARGMAFAFATNGGVYVGGGMPVSPSATGSVEMLGTPSTAGTACKSNQECASGFCVDGVCCNSTCSGTCQACDEPASIGTCITVSGTPRGTRACATPGGDPTCGQRCDGSTAASCSYPSTSVVCIASSCDAGGNFTAASYCNGSGACGAKATPKACAPYACGTAGCVTACSVDADCTPTSYCDTSTSKCLARSVNGTAASSPSQCLSGFLADGYCCDSACTSACHTCAKSGSQGTCVALDGVADPRGVCPVGPCAGFCVAGACGFKPMGTACGPTMTSCTGSMLTKASTCDGTTAICPGATPTPCPGGLVCTTDGTSCKASCASNGDCVAGLCDPSSWQCVVVVTPDAGPDVAPDTTPDAEPEAAPDGAPEAAPDATPEATEDGPVAEAITPAGTPPAISATFSRCERDADCKDTGHCVEGVCCDTACTDKCHSCALPSSPGKCTPEPLGTDLRNECGPSLSCLGTCDGNGGCIGAGPGTQCARNRCDTASTGVGAAYCAAAGSACQANLVVPFDCAPYACEPAFGACRTSCVTTSDCAPGNECDTSTQQCVAPPPPPSSSGCAAGGGDTEEGGAVFAFGLVVVVAARRRRARR